MPKETCRKQIFEVRQKNYLQEGLAPELYKLSKVMEQDDIWDKVKSNQDPRDYQAEKVNEK